MLVIRFILFIKREIKTSLVVQWLRLCAANAGGAGLIPDQGTKMALVLVIRFILFIKREIKTSLVVQWLRLCAANAGGAGLIPDQGTKIPHAVWYNQKIKKRERNSFLQ